MMASLKAILALLLLTIASLCLIPLQWIAVRLGLDLRRRLPVLWHRIALALVGIRVTQVGAPVVARPLLVAANHASWIDISVVGSLMPLSFIAKSEVSGWPIFGLLAKLQRTVFVNRQRRAETGKVADIIAERMVEGDAMVLFAEGTSNDGNCVLPFRSALLGAVTRGLADDGPVHVQPLSIAYTGLAGLPMGRQFRNHVAWYGDMELAGHLWAVFREGAIDVTVTWGEEVEIVPGTDRKRLTRQLEENVRQMTVAVLNGAAQAEDSADPAASAISKRQKSG